jgi:hypothetical protein
MLANRLAHGKETLKRVFAVLIFIVGAYILYRSGRTDDDKLGKLSRRSQSHPRLGVMKSTVVRCNRMAGI